MSKKMDTSEAIDALVNVLEQDQLDDHLSEEDLNKGLEAVAVVINIVKKRRGIK